MDEGEIVKEFLVESYENLDRLDRELVELEKNPQDGEALASIFRTIHTIKGTCGFLGFGKLEAVAHAGESLLSRLRDRQLTLTPKITTALLSLVDAVRQMLSHIDTSGLEGERDDTILLATLVRLQQPSEAIASDVEAIPATIGEILMERAGVTPAEILHATQLQQAGDPRRLGEILVDQGAARPADVVDALRIQQSTRVPASASDSSIRVDVAALDKVMNLVGELVLARNQVLQFAHRLNDRSFLAVSQRLNLITSEVQAGVMKTRMQSIGHLWDQFPRTVRDVAVGCGKEVSIEMVGKETELDKTILEAIKGPLTHLVRNAVDHGIELPEDRVKAGKDRNGHLVLRAFHEGGQVNLEISDDGAGLNGARIRQKALERGLITAEQSVRMPEREVFNLIFLPGFSTADKVTNVSGRGVGMDVVKTNVEKIGGTVDVQSTLTQGTTVRVKIPLTLAIVPALLVTCSGDRYAIPQASLLELLRLAPDQSPGIETLQGAPVYRLRGNLLPLLFLSQELQLSGSAQLQPPESRAVNIVVLQADGRQFGLVVDEINDTEEIVVKPLGKELKDARTFSGATIMGDGKVALILDAMGIAQQANLTSRTPDHSPENMPFAAESAANLQPLLLFQAGKNERMAIPLSQVARLEEIARTTVEHAGQHPVVQYRGQIMPLIDVSEVMGLSRLVVTDPAVEGLQVVVYAEQGRSVGLVVERILDIVEQDLSLETMAHRPGILGSAVVQQQVTDLLDVPGIVQAAYPGFFADAAAQPISHQRKERSANGA